MNRDYDPMWRSLHPARPCVPMGQASLASLSPTRGADGNCDSPRVLFFTSNEDDYLSDGLLHGLRTLLGSNVVDFPRNDLMYEDVKPEVRRRSHGQAFTLYGRLPNIEVDRFHVLRRVREGEFDLIVFSDIHRQYGYLMQLLGSLDRARLAIVDGSDSSEPFPFTGRYVRNVPLWLIPRCWDIPHFKREIDRRTHRGYTYRAMPMRFAHWVPLPSHLRPISFSIPEELVVPTLPAKTKDMPSHVVDKEVAERLGSVRLPDRTYIFGDEAGYIADLRASRFGVTTRRGGWDCLRHYEIAAAAAVPCFRALDEKPALCAPHGLDRTNTIIYRDVDHLFSQLEQLTDERYRSLQSGALAWARRSTTRVRAIEFLRALGFEPPAH